MSKRPAEYDEDQPIMRITGKHIARTYRTASWCDSLAKYEGVDWIRGHHSVDSHEVKALLVAFALYQN